MSALNVQEVTITINSANIKTLHSSPREIIAAPGANKYIELLTWRIIYKFGTIPYTGGGDRGGGAGTTLLTYGSDNTGAAIAASAAINFRFLESAISIGPGWIERGNSMPEFVSSSLVVNKNVTLADLTADYIDGDGVAIVTVCYRIVDMPA